jgi:hypothetical protein
MMTSSAIVAGPDLWPMNQALARVPTIATTGVVAGIQGRKVEERGVSDELEYRPSGPSVVRKKNRGLLYAWRLLRQLPWLRLRYKL